MYVELAEQYKIVDAASDVAKRNLVAQHLREVIDIIEQKVSTSFSYLSVTCLTHPLGRPNSFSIRSSRSSGWSVGVCPAQKGCRIQQVFAASSTCMLDSHPRINFFEFIPYISTSCIIYNNSLCCVSQSRSEEQLRSGRRAADQGN